MDVFYVNLPVFIFSVLNAALTGFEFHPASYPMGNWDSLSGVTATGT
jgi:hypothetical protein